MNGFNPPLLFFSGLFGLILGSFATCAGHRLATGGSVLTPARSYCPACRHTLGLSENIPLFGWILLRGKCRHCGAAIPARYPLTELACGIFAVLAAVALGPTPHLAVALAFATLCLVLSLIDLKTQLLPDVLTLPGAAAALICSALLPPLWTLGVGWRAALLGAAVGGGGLWLIAFLYERLRGVEGLGLGDAKLMMLFGALLGPVAVPIILFIGACLSLPAGIAAARAGGDESAGLRARVPFGPFLCAAALAYLLGGPYLLHGWLGLPLPPRP